MSTTIVKQAEIELLDYVPKNESNKQTVDMINGMLKLIHEHLCKLERVTHITHIIFACDARLVSLDNKFSKGFENFKFTFKAFGSSKEFTLAEVATLLKLASVESETTILDELKTLVQNQMVFYGRFMECTTDLGRAWDEVIQEFGGDFRDGSFHIKHALGIEPVHLRDCHLNNFEFQYMWLEWSKVATAFLKYMFNVCKHSETTSNK
jgi:hypothetical protein